jgi:hypothetical protein
MTSGHGAQMRRNAVQFEPLTPRQKIAIIAVAAILWLPMILFFIFYSDKLSERQNASVAAVNLIFGVTALIVISRKWIMKVKR